jgi:hypothetical protein
MICGKGPLQLFLTVEMYPHARCQWPLIVDDQSFRQSKELSGVNAYSRWSTPDLASFIKSDQPRITADSRIRPRLGAHVRLHSDSLPGMRSVIAAIDSLGFSSSSEKKNRSY